MSILEDFEQYEYERFSICVSSEFEDESELKDIFTELSEMEKPEFLGNHLMDVDSEEPKESSIVFADKDPEDHKPPRSEANAALANVTEFWPDDEENFHIHIDIVSQELISDFSNLLTDFTDAVGRLYLQSCRIQLDSELPLGSYTLPIDASTDCDVTGIRYAEDDYNHIFQSDEEFYDEETTSYRNYTKKEYYIDDTNSEDFIVSEINSTLEYLEELEQ